MTENKPQPTQKIINEVLMAVASINLELPTKVADDVRDKVMKLIDLVKAQPTQNNADSKLVLTIRDIEEKAQEIIAIPKENKTVKPLNEWLPIETIPRDGNKYQIAWFKDGKCTDIGIVYYSYYTPYGDGKKKYTWAGDFYKLGYATHWQPLPQPPSADGREEV